MSDTSNTAPSGSGDNISDNIQDGTDVNEMDIDQESVQVFEQRFTENFPTLPQMAQFEQLLNPQGPGGQLAQALAKIAPEVIMGFLAAVQDMQQNAQVQGAPGQPPGAPGSTMQGNGGMAPAGGANGAMAPTLQSNAPDDDDDDAMGGMGGGQSAQPPAATSFGNPPPSMPAQGSGLRRQVYTGR